jgi:hypothetical protein
MAFPKAITRSADTDLPRAVDFILVNFLYAPDDGAWIEVEWGHGAGTMAVGVLIFRSLI